tara:strand:+ start:1307 stop:1459 length:153 start_codon:yes stop_codon:yes gene_type:complete
MEEINNYYDKLKVIFKEKKPETQEEEDLAPEKEKKPRKKSEKEIFYVTKK